MLKGTPKPLTGTRVALVCGHFAPEIGYQEVDLARALARLGACVRVVTTTRLSPNARTLLDRDYEPGFGCQEGYEILRLSPHVAFGPNVLGPDVRPAVADYRPHCVILVGPSKLFGLELFSSKRCSWKRIAVIQDNSEDSGARRRSRKRLSARAFAHRIVKRPAYRRVIRNADAIVLNVPETFDLVAAWVGRHSRDLMRSKAVELRLGFDPRRFFFDPDERRTWRDRHGFQDAEFVLGTCTRTRPEKKLEDVITAVSRLRARGVPIRYVLAGVLDDEYGSSLLRHAKAQPDPAAFLVLPALRQDEMRMLFCGCDLGYWPQAAITIQQAMGTGLPVILKRTPTVSHLLRPPDNGRYIDGSETIDETLSAALAVLTPVTVGEVSSRRRRLAGMNRQYLSYDVIALEMIEAARLTPTTASPHASGSA